MIPYRTSYLHGSVWFSLKKSHAPWCVYVWAEMESRWISKSTYNRKIYLKLYFWFRDEKSFYTGINIIKFIQSQPHWELTSKGIIMHSNCFWSNKILLLSSDDFWILFGINVVWGRTWAFKTVLTYTVVDVFLDMSDS